MITQLENHSEYLNSIFSDKDFNFLSCTDKDLDKLKYKIENQEKKKETISIFFNKLKETLNSDIIVLNNLEIKNIILELENIFKVIDDNIFLLNNLENSIKYLNQDVVKLLILIESNSDSDVNNDYFDEIQTIKEKINTYSTQLNNTNSKILLNDIKIDTFITNQATQTYLNMFDINTSIFYKNNDLSIEGQSAVDSKNFNYNIDDSIDSFKKESNILIVSEKLNKVFLPYKFTEVENYLTTYPEQYKSFEDVINKEFVLPLDYYIKHPVISRFREAYALIRDREGKSIIDAMKVAFDLMLKYELNPTIIAGCKTQEQLENYLNCLDNNQLNNFKEFEIRFELNPI